MVELTLLCCPVSPRFETNFYKDTRPNSKPAARKLLTARRAQAEPAVAHLMVMDLRIVDRDRQVQFGRRQPADGRQQTIRSDDPVVLRYDQALPGVDQNLLRIEHILRCALPG